MVTIQPNSQHNLPRIFQMQNRAERLRPRRVKTPRPTVETDCVTKHRARRRPLQPNRNLSIFFFNRRHFQGGGHRVTHERRIFEYCSYATNGDLLSIANDVILCRVSVERAALAAQLFVCVWEQFGKPSCERASAGARPSLHARTRRFQSGVRIAQHQYWYSKIQNKLSSLFVIIGTKNLNEFLAQK